MAILLLHKVFILEYYTSNLLHIHTNKGCGKGIQMYRYMSCSSLIFLGIVMCVTCLITGCRWYCCGKGIHMYRYMSCSSLIFLGIVMCVTTTRYQTSNTHDDS
jgi:predicted transcriptional regulator with HTH domain